MAEVVEEVTVAEVAGVVGNQRAALEGDWAGVVSDLNVMVENFVGLVDTGVDSELKVMVENFVVQLVDNFGGDPFTSVVVLVVHGEIEVVLAGRLVDLLEVVTGQLEVFAGVDVEQLEGLDFELVVHGTEVEKQYDGVTVFHTVLVVVRSDDVSEDAQYWSHLRNSPFGAP